MPYSLKPNVWECDFLDSYRKKNQSFYLRLYSAKLVARIKLFSVTVS